MTKRPPSHNYGMAKDSARYFSVTFWEFTRVNKTSGLTLIQWHFIRTTGPNFIGNYHVQVWASRPVSLGARR